MSLWERFGSPFRITSGSLLDHLATPHRPFFAKNASPYPSSRPTRFPPGTHPSSPEKTGHPLPDQTRCSGFPVDSEGEPGHDDHPRASISLPGERVPRSGQRSRWKDRSARKTARWVPVRTKGAAQKVYLPSQLEPDEALLPSTGSELLIFNDPPNSILSQLCDPPCAQGAISHDRHHRLRPSQH